MKKSLTTLLLSGSLLSSVAQTIVAPVNVTLQKSPDTNVLAYRIYYGTQSSNYTSFVEIPAKTNDVQTARINVPTGTSLFFNATALNETTESDYFNEIPFETQPGATLHGFTVRAPRTIFNYTAQTRHDNKNWYLYRSRNMVTWERIVKLNAGTNLNATIYQIFPVSFFKIQNE